MPGRDALRPLRHHCPRSGGNASAHAGAVVCVRRGAMRAAAVEVERGRCAGTLTTPPLLCNPSRQCTVCVPVTSAAVRPQNQKLKEGSDSVASQAARGHALSQLWQGVRQPDVMRDPMRKRQKEWSSEPLMCTVDRGQLHLSVPSGLCAWRSAPEQQIATRRQGKWSLSPSYKLQPLPMSRQGQRRCCDE